MHPAKQDHCQNDSSAVRRIAQVVQHLRPGGIESLALDLVATPKGAEGIIISLEDEREGAQANWPRLQDVKARMAFLSKRPGIHPGLIRKLVDHLRQERVDVVHTHHIGPLLYAGIAARLAGVRHLIHTEHDAWHLEARGRRMLQRAVLWLTRPTLVADAQIVADNMSHHLGNREIHIIRNGIDTERFSPGDKNTARHRLRLPLFKPLIGCAGRLEHVKGQDILIDALGLMPGNQHLALAGSGSKEGFLRAKARQMGLSDRVHFLGHVEEMPDFYRSLDTFVLPSRKEGYPLSALEAQACSIVTAVTDVGGSRETLCPHTGKLLTPENPAAMAVALCCLHAVDSIHDPRTFVLKHGDLKVMTEAYRELVQ